MITETGWIIKYPNPPNSKGVDRYMGDFSVIVEDIERAKIYPSHAMAQAGMNLGYWPAPKDLPPGTVVKVERTATTKTRELHG